MSDHTDHSAPPRSYEVPGIYDELGTADCPASVMHAYWLGVYRMHALRLCRKLEGLTEPSEIGYCAEMIERITRRADEQLALLKSAVAAERDAPQPPAPSFRRIVAEFDCGAHARDYAKAHGYTVTAGVNRLFAVWEVTP